MMRWWWFGPSVTKPEIEREIRAMKEGGIGGFEVQPVYPVALDDAASGIHTPAYLSDEFLEALRFASGQAREHGLRMDLTLGSGWPFGGPHIPISQAAGRLRVDRLKYDGRSRVPLPYIGTGEQLIAVFAGGVELTDIRDGAVWLPETAKPPLEILVFVSSRTGMMVKRAAIGAEGYVLDHYDRAALETHLKAAGDRMMRALGPQPPYAVFCDSLEVFGSDWTPTFLREFRARRGYDLKPHLPALVSNTDPQSAVLRQDWGKTLTELANERFLTPLREWARQNHTLVRVQAYGMPPASISSGSLVDLPEGEGAQWKVLTPSRWASSASHLYGRTVTSSETWTWLHSPSFAATPLDMKAEANLHFLQGINQLIGHGWPYSAPSAEYPGWRFYAAGVFNDSNPWWIVMPDVAAYLQRVSFVLRQGEPVNDVAVYLPAADAYSRFRPGRVNLLEASRECIGTKLFGQISEAGFGLDVFDDAVLAELGRVEKGALVMGRNRYRVVVLPGVETIPAATYAVLERFAADGGILVATRRLPKLAPGFLAGAADHAKIAEASQRLFEGASARAHFIEDEGKLSATLAGLLRPDVAFSAALGDLGFVHRRAGSNDIYFVANTANVRRKVEATFRSAAAAEMLDPMNGRAAGAPVLRRAQGATTLALDLEPYGSRVIVFSDASGAVPPRQQAVSANGAAAFEMDVSEGWTVRFGDRPAVPMPALRSWTEDDATLYYSGQATYEKGVTVPDAKLSLRLDFGEGRPLPESPSRSGMRAWLDAPVREAAVVYVNGRRAGSVWCPPYSVDLTGLLKPGENRIRIVVANLAINHMAGRALPDYRLLNVRYGVRFEPQDMNKVKPVPSGLLGPIRLVAGE